MLTVRVCAVIGMEWLCAGRVCVCCDRNGVVVCWPCVCAVLAVRVCAALVGMECVCALAAVI